MGTSRKRTRELKKLRGEAAGIWSEQRELLSHSKDFWQNAGSEAASIAVNDVAPRVRAAYEKQVKPAVSTGVANASVAATHAKDRLVNDVAPAVSSAIAGSALGDLADDPRVKNLVSQGQGLVKDGKKLSKKAKRKALKKAARTAAKHPRATAKVAKTVHAYKKSRRSGIGPGGVFLIVLGVVGLGALVFAAVQTLRADDELWVADDDESTTAK
ncbi:hypothetical protein AS850_00055 [Frondihabitans sp. 762G35]|uniref:hypothetical protein n=1 Tax=Frondihabitans sp. 762G35 TaxID=1446794 RepID=UPI000D20F0D3|nr:hypothetical protein [Frondihabitans sp. 762G35]ARC55467.1 hypothetical protein AS850_00055 [Frondihabitans sp. 762G35]